MTNLPRQNSNLLLEAVASSSEWLIQSHHHYEVGSPSPPTAHAGYYNNPGGFGFAQSQSPMSSSSFIGIFPLLSKIVWYFFVGVLLMCSSLCLYGIFYKTVMPGLHASETLYFNYQGMHQTNQYFLSNLNQNTSCSCSCNSTNATSIQNTIEVPIRTTSPNNNLQQQHINYHHQQQYPNNGTPKAVVDLFSRKNQWHAHHSDVIPYPKTQTRILPPGVPHYIEIVLDLPESNQNKNMGMFGVLVELHSHYYYYDDNNTNHNSTTTIPLASSMRTVRFPYESSWIAVVRKMICIIPILLGALQESRRVSVPSFRFFVESSKLPLRYVTVSLHNNNIIMTPEKFPQGEVLEVLQGFLHIGKELTDFQWLLKEWFFTCFVVGTLSFYVIQVLILLAIQQYWEYQQKQQQKQERINLEDDASDAFGFDGMTEDDHGVTENRNAQGEISQSRNEDDDDDDDGDAVAYFECDDAFDDSQEGEWEDLPTIDHQIHTTAGNTSAEERFPSSETDVPESSSE